MEVVAVALYLMREDYKSIALRLMLESCYVVAISLAVGTKDDLIRLRPTGVTCLSVCRPALEADFWRFDYLNARALFL